MRVKNERARGLMHIALRERDAMNNSFQDILRADTLFRRGKNALIFRYTNYVLDLLHDPFGFGAWQVDLVNYRNDIQICFKRQVQVRERLGLDPLRGIDHQQRSFTGSQAARYLVGKVNVTGSIDQVQFILLPIERLIEHAYGLSFDGNTLLTLQIHLVEYLLRQFALRYGSCKFPYAVSKGRFAMVYMSDSTKISNMFLIRHSINPPD